MNTSSHEKKRMITTLVFDSQLLPDGHLTCPQEFIRKKNIQFKVLVIFEEPEGDATDQDIERAALQDKSNDILSDEEIQYYMSLEDL
jgi:hypothetical protein